MYYEGQAAIELEIQAKQAISLEAEQYCFVNLDDVPLLVEMDHWQTRPGVNIRPYLPLSVSRRKGMQSSLTEQYAFSIEPTQLDVTPLIRAIVDDIQQSVPVPQIASRFHCSIAELLARTCDEVRIRTGLERVALSGGVFQNQVLRTQLLARLETMAFQVYVNQRVPCNDGGLSLGQIAIAAARLING